MRVISNVRQSATTSRAGLTRKAPGRGWGYALLVIADSLHHSIANDNRRPSHLLFRQQHSLDKAIDASVQHIADIADIQVDAVILYHLIGMQNV